MTKFPFCFLFCLMLVFGTQCSKHQQITLSDGIVVENATIISFDSTGQLVRFEGSIAIDSNRIIYANKSRPKVSGSFKYIDARGKYVIPGLIDSHVHLANMAGMTIKHQRLNQDLREEYFDNIGKNFLYFGYTTLVDLNAYNPSLIKRIRNQEDSPDIYTCGEQLMIMGGFMAVMNELDQSSRYAPPFLYDPYNSKVEHPDSIVLENFNSKSALNRIVEEQNGICAKLLYEDEYSGLKVTWEKPSQALLLDVVSDSKEHGIPVIMHAPSYEGQKKALGCQC